MKKERAQLWEVKNNFPSFRCISKQTLSIQFHDQNYGRFLHSQLENIFNGQIVPNEFFSEAREFLCLHLVILSFFFLLQSYPLILLLCFERDELFLILSLFFNKMIRVSLLMMKRIGAYRETKAQIHDRLDKLINSYPLSTNCK